ncbi:MAG: hypothetical protein WCW03_03325 [Candidatus Paceibacterota bacterium]
MKVARRKKAQRELAKDLVFVFIGAVIALLLSQSGVISVVIDFLGGTAISSFVAGIFFTSVFTIAPASVAFADISQTGAPLTIILWGGLGAMCGDLILFFFIRDRFTDDLLNSMRPSIVKHILASFHLGFMKWLSPILGALIISSPLPDELGLTLMGLSKMRIAVLMPVSLIMNMMGIYLICWLAQVV